MKKSILSLLLALCLIIPAFADGDGSSDTLTVDGVTTRLDTAASGTGWSYDGAMTLTLSDYHGGQIFFDPSIQAHRCLSVVLQGNSSAPNIFASPLDEVGEYMFDEVHFCGTGSLDLSGESSFGGPSALYSMEGCTITANARMVEQMTFRVGAGAELRLNDDNSGGNLAKNSFVISGGTVVFTNVQDTAWYFGVSNEYITNSCTCEIYEGGMLKIVRPQGEEALLAFGSSDLFSKFIVTDGAGTPGVLLEPNSVGNGYVGREGSESSFGTVCISGSGKAPEQPAIEPVLPVQPAGSTLTAAPTASTVLVNGVPMSFDAYNIGGSNYFKLRDLAYVLSGTEKQFEVSWDASANAISLTSGQPYTAVGGEMTPGTGAAQTPIPTQSKILRNGWEVSFEAYNIGGNNYFKLRDLGGAFDFGVDWDAAANTIVIDTSKSYTPA